MSKRLMAICLLLSLVLTAPTVAQAKDDDIGFCKGKHSDCVKMMDLFVVGERDESLMLLEKLETRYPKDAEIQAMGRIMRYEPVEKNEDTSNVPLDPEVKSALQKSREANAELKKHQDEARQMLRAIRGTFQRIDRGSGSKREFERHITALDRVIDRIESENTE